MSIRDIAKLVLKLAPTIATSIDGLTAKFGLNGQDVVSFTGSGLQFTKNKLINGEVTRINQRAFNGTWSGKSVWETQPATIAGKEAAYGYDMWFRSNVARLDGTGASENMAQWIESGNYRPSTVHTLSGTGVTTTQITSPASGDWKIVVAQGATNVQVEEGNVATPFELRDLNYEMMRCVRFYQRADFGLNDVLTTTSTRYVIFHFNIMRTSPVASTTSAYVTESNVASAAVVTTFPQSGRADIVPYTASEVYCWRYVFLSAVI